MHRQKDLSRLLLRKWPTMQMRRLNMLKVCTENFGVHVNCTRRRCWCTTSLQCSLRKRQTIANVCSGRCNVAEKTVQAVFFIRGPFRHPVLLHFDDNWLKIGLPDNFGAASKRMDVSGCAYITKLSNVRDWDTVVVSDRSVFVVELNTSI